MRKYEALARKHRRVKKLAAMLSAAVGILRDPSAVGRKWEEKFIRLSNKKGYAAVREDNGNARFGAVVCGWRVQCKMRKRLQSGKVELIYRERTLPDGTKKRAYLLGEFDFLALRCEKKTYIIPEFALASGDGLTLVNDINPDHFSQFIDNWSAFNGKGVSSLPMQMRLFG